MKSADPFLWELFKEELDLHGSELTKGLLSFESEGFKVIVAESLMRAAHSIKGAARVVELAALAEICHEMEAIFFALSEHAAPIKPDAADDLLKVTDWMVELSKRPHYPNPEEIISIDLQAKIWRKRLKTHLTGEQPEIIHENLSSSIGGLVNEPIGEVSPEENRDSFIKVTPNHLGNIMSRSSEMLLETHKLEALSPSLKSLRTLTQQSLLSISRIDGSSNDLKVCTTNLMKLVDRLDSFIEDFKGAVSNTRFLAERLHLLATQSRMRPFSDVVRGFPRLVRELSKELDKTVNLSIQGDKTWVDRDVLVHLEAPINHLIRNALDHGFETKSERIAASKDVMGQLIIEARHHRGRLLISVSDDGRGIDFDRLRAKLIREGFIAADQAPQMTTTELSRFLFLAGFSTRDSVTELSGRGYGLDVVQDVAEMHGGNVSVASEAGIGTRFELSLPIARSVVRSLEVSVGGQSFAFPFSDIVRTLTIHSSDLLIERGILYLDLDNERLPLIPAAALMQMPIDGVHSDVLLSVVLIETRHGKFAVEVDHFNGHQDLIVRPFDTRLGQLPGLSSAAINDLGSVVFLFDVDDLSRSASRYLTEHTIKPVEELSRTTRPIRVLIVDDSLTVREREKELLETFGYEVYTAVNGFDALTQFTQADFDLVVTDVDMPCMNGLEFVRKLRLDKKLLSVPVIMVSYKDSTEDRLKGLEAGADFYLSKNSLQNGALIETILSHFGKMNDTINLG